MVRSFRVGDQDPVTGRRHGPEKSLRIPRRTRLTVPGLYLPSVLLKVCYLLFPRLRELNGHTTSRGLASGRRPPAGPGSGRSR
jgi:hypothetical protein